MMTKGEAIARLVSAAEDEDIGYREARDLFAAIYDRAPDSDDGDAGELVSLCYADPDVARGAVETACECGGCEWSGPAAETVLVEYMPEHLRDSHTAAGNVGTYPHNGSIRVRVERSCAERLAGEWCREVQ